MDYKYSNLIKELHETKSNHPDSWQNINAEYLARMRLQNRFKTGLEIAKYTASIMRRDMEDYDNDPSQYTQSLGSVSYTHLTLPTIYSV